MTSPPTCEEIKVNLCFNSGVSREALLSGYGRVYPSEIVSEFGPKTWPRCRDNLTHWLISTQVMNMENWNDAMWAMQAAVGKYTWPFFYAVVGFVNICLLNLFPLHKELF